MASRSSPGLVRGAIVGVAILAGIALACEPAVPPDPGTAPPAGSAGAPPSAAIGRPSPSIPGRDAPPEAVLAAEGGDPVKGELGTFVWFETGSDSPWLQGAPLAVGAGEPLTVTLVPDSAIGDWTARSVPAGAQGPGGARTLARGTGRLAFDAPEVGIWTVEVLVEFAGGIGSASYFWRLEVE
jgi:hypothetical protein